MGIKVVQSPLNSCQEQPLMATNQDCIGSQVVVALPKLIDLTFPICTHPYVFKKLSCESDHNYV